MKAITNYCRKFPSALVRQAVATVILEGDGIAFLGELYIIYSL